MRNLFYDSKDSDFLDGSGPEQPKDYRGPFQIDRDRIVFSYAFRRLQSKTQVFQSGVYDYYRTRLTHSIEVARIGRSICDILRADADGPLREDYYIDPDLVEAISLAHDLGHPAFGHIGERKLNELMEDFGGYEGNAQTIRILTALLYKKGPSGMRPTRAFLDGVAKYKALRSEMAAAVGGPPENHFLYDEQVGVREHILDGANFDALPEPKALNRLRSIECQIMDWADDTAYSLHDILDGIQTGFITHRKLKSWGEANELAEDQRAHLDELIDSTLKGNIEARFGVKIGRFIAACKIREQEGPLSAISNRHRYRLEIDPAAERECALYKRLAVNLVFESPEIQQLEYKGGYVLERLFNTLMDEYSGRKSRPLRLLPEEETEMLRACESETERARLICDYLAGLTDLAAPRLYRQLFTPENDTLGQTIL